VLVTHDLGAVHQFCDRAIWLQSGAIRRDGDPREVVRAYLREVNAGDQAASELSSADRPGAAGTHTPLNSGVPIVLHALRVTAADGAERSIYENGETLRVEVGYEARNPVRSPICEVEVHRHDGTHVATGSTFAAGLDAGDVLEGRGRFVWQLDDLRLTPGTYYLSPVLRDYSGVHVLDRHERWVRVQVREGRYLEHAGCVVLPGTWEVQRED
jgi:lipopolysaccharide transport system ATP-binding protein